MRLFEQWPSQELFSYKCRQDNEDHDVDEAPVQAGPLVFLAQGSERRMPKGFAFFGTGTSDLTFSSRVRVTFSALGLAGSSQLQPPSPYKNKGLA